MGIVKKTDQFVFLTDRHRCPKCLARIDVVSGANCRNCGTKLFLRPIDFKKFEDETGLLYWWCWHHENGWMHRDHFMVEGVKPNHREYKVPKLPKDYGLHTTPEEVAMAPRKMREKRLKIIK